MADHLPYLGPKELAVSGPSERETRQGGEARGVWGGEPWSRWRFFSVSGAPCQLSGQEVEGFLHGQGCFLFAFFNSFGGKRHMFVLEKREAHAAGQGRIGMHGSVTLFSSACFHLADHIKNGLLHIPCGSLERIVAYL